MPETRAFNARRPKDAGADCCIEQQPTAQEKRVWLL